jgi:acyl-CoA synthetase (AMP-forming)/AMP-acid ligase II
MLAWRRQVKPLASSLAVVGRSGLLGAVPAAGLSSAGRALRRYRLSLAATVPLAAARHPARPAIVDEAGVMTWAELDAATDAIAAWFYGRGVVAGDEVGVLCRNHRYLVLAIGGLSKLGVHTAYLNTGFAGPQLVEVARREGVKALVLDGEFVTLADPLLLPLILAWKDEGPVYPDLPSLDDALRAPGPHLFPSSHRSTRQIVLTSGTTGSPKGAQRHFDADPEVIVSLLDRIPLRSSDRTVIAAPMFHSWGLINTAFALLLGATMVLPRRFDPEEVLRLIDVQRASALIAVPVMLQRILDLPESVRRRYDTSTLRLTAVSGSSLPGDLATEWMDAFGDGLHNLYGSTEVGWASIAKPEDLRAAPGTAGRVPLWMEVRILAEDGAEAPTGQHGRIFVRSRLLFEGYTGGGSKHVVDGFMATGDVGHFDERGLLFVDGRDDDMIISGGENVFPREVEDLLATHPAVAEAAVVGVSDDEWGQRLVAFVSLRQEAVETAEALRDFVRLHLARYKVPRQVVLLPELPRNATGKVLKRELVASLGPTP